MENTTDNKSFLLALLYLLLSFVAICGAGKIQNFLLNEECVNLILIYSLAHIDTILFAKMGLCQRNVRSQS